MKGVNYYKKETRSKAFIAPQILKSDIDSSLAIRIKKKVHFHVLKMTYCGKSYIYRKIVF